ncbi:ATP-dependent DNA helicase RecQ [Sporolactobacillus sp. THM7-7]|nr:ATP-dependent DNA helicase RecQ [Sporolactobacillus sp. THM7-7]
MSRVNKIQKMKPFKQELMKKAERVLKHTFGYDAFRPGQKPVVEALLSGEDVFAMMPTGSGKSICYQVPGYLLSGLVLVVSPLLSLMEDQMASLRRIGESKVRALNSMLHPKERSRVLRQLNALRFLFISPEMLRRPAVVSRLEETKLSLFVVDEAHCISQWGYEFRPDYLHLAEIRERIGAPICLALTATADRGVREDIIRHLRLENSRQFLQSVDRPNIAVAVHKVENDTVKTEQLLQLLGKVRLPGIIYCASRGWTQRLTDIIRNRLPLRTAFYHGGMLQEDRRKIQNQFLDGELDVLCCTNAFGMGINKPDVRLIVHFHYPRHMNAYLQEIGRAGRDGKQSLAVLYYSKEDDRLPLSFIDSDYPSPEMLKKILLCLDRREWRIEDERQFLSAAENEGASETAARFVWEQVGRKPPGVSFLSILDDCLRKIGERKRRQLEDLAAMRSWISEEGCRRKAYLRLFDETLTVKPRLCCDRCGFPPEAFRREGRLGNRDDREISWESRLKRLLLKKLS